MPSQTGDVILDIVLIHRSIARIARVMDIQATLGLITSITIESIN